MNQKIKLIELFSGIGAQERALRALGIPYEVVATCDLEPYAILSYAAMRHDFQKEFDSYEFPSRDEMITDLVARNIGYDFKKGKQTITKRTPLTKLKQFYLADKLTKNLGDISKVEKLPDCDILFHSSPCFVPGTMVLTDTGFKNIEDITTDDSVLTHTNTYQRVVEPMKHYHDGDIFKISTQCSNPIYATPEHPFYVRPKFRKWNNERRSYDSVYGDPSWVKAKDLSKDYYIGVAINQNAIIPKWEGMTFKWKNSTRTQYSNVLGKYMDNADFWWLVGRYIGDGWLSKGYGKNPSYGIKICDSSDKTHEITGVVERLGFNYCICHEKTVDKVQISGKELYKFFSQFGCGASNKRFTNTIFDLPVDLLKSVIDGYMSADGCIDNGAYRMTSTSRELMYGLGQCVAKAYHASFSVFETKRPETTVIEGRTVNQKNSWTCTYRVNPNRQQGFYADGCIWTPIRNVEKESYSGYVYNMEVENDHSYTVQNLIVHNCQTFSVAGLGLGGDEGSGTASSLMWESVRLIKTSLPKIVIWENVANVTSKKHIHNLEKYIDVLGMLGYKSTYKILNSKDYGIPQNRRRIFCISERTEGDATFTFPEAIPLDMKLKDILEDRVDESYYLDDDKIKDILADLLERMKKDCGNDINQLGNWAPTATRDNPNQGRVYDPNGISPALTTMEGGNLQPFIVASRGRDPENPSDRTSGNTNLVQRLEPNNSGICNTITTVTKDCLVCEPKIAECIGGVGEKKSNGGTQYFQQDRIYCGDIALAHPANLPGGSYKYLLDWRVRKLTEKECWRLMGFTDEDVDRAAEFCPASALYKQAGNSIVVACLVAIFSSLLVEDGYKADVWTKYFVHFN